MQIRIVCVAPEVYCAWTDPSTDVEAGRCTTTAICMDTNFMSPLLDYMPTLSGSIINSSRFNPDVMRTDFEQATSSNALQIALVGPRFVEIELNGIFDRSEHAQLRALLVVCTN